MTNNAQAKNAAPPDDYKNRKGYTAEFIGGAVVPLPDISGTSNLFKPGITPRSPYEIPYHHFSVILHKKRKFPLLTACNIDGTSFQNTARINNWRVDPRAKAYQWGSELYSVKKSDFDKGHMTKREDPAWGANVADAFAADQDTFHYSNAVPQVHELNGVTWKELEDHVLQHGAVAAALKLCVFTGPVLHDRDLPFVTTVKDATVLLPRLFWKVIVWKKKKGGLFAVGFVMSQENYLLSKGIVNQPAKMKAALASDDVFEHIQFKDKKTYQVRIAHIEQLTRIRFNWKNVTFPYTAKAVTEIKRTRQTRSMTAATSRVSRRTTRFQLQNITL